MLNWQLIVAWLNHWAAWLFAAGMAASISFHVVKWLQGQKLAHRLREQKRPLPFLSEAPKVSALVAAWNEAVLLEKHIRAFLTLRYPHKELILCAGGEDGTLELARRHTGRQVIVLEQKPGDGKQGALRKCLAKADGEIIFLADADGLLDDESFESTLVPIIAGHAQAASGRTCPLPGQMRDPFVLYQWYAEQYAAASAGPYVPLLRGCNGAILRTTLASAGDFDEATIIGTDDHLSHKLRQQGIRIRFVRESQVANEYPEDVKGYLRQQSRWLRVAILRGLKHRDGGAWLTIAGFGVYALPILFLLATPLIGMFGLYAALLLLVHMFGARLRIMVFGLEYAGGDFPWWHYPNLALYLLFDFYVRAATVCQLIWPPARQKW